MDIGICTSTALEIYTNPRDLEIEINKEKGQRSFSFGIFRRRGRWHKRQVLIASDNASRKRERVIEIIEDILQEIHKEVEADRMIPKSASSVYLYHLSPDGEDLPQSKILHPDLIGKIISKLRKKDKVRTRRIR